MKWQVGDVAILIDDGKVYGEGCCILGEVCILIKWDLSEQMWLVDVGGEPDWLVNELCLRLLPDGNQASTWEDCIFKPKELVT